MRIKREQRWLFFILLIIVVISLIWDRSAISDGLLKRNETTAEHTQTINPLTPAAKATGVVLDNTVNKVLPFDLSTESQLARDESDCYRSCYRNKEQKLRVNTTEVNRGEAWNEFYKCKSGCPEKAANRTEFRKRAPAGSVINDQKRRY